MTPTFKKLKQGNFLLAWIKSIAIGFAVGAFACGGGLLAVKIAELAFPIGFVFLIGLGVALLAWLFAFLILRKSEKALAKRLDNKYVLHEKVQTMLEYADGQAEMLVLQRQDAEMRLQNSTKGKISLGKIWVHAVSVVLALATLVTGLVLPTTGNANKGNADSIFVFTQWHYNYMKELIAYVDESPMHVNAKPTTKAELERLLDEVCSYDEETQTLTSLLTTSEMKSKVNDSITYLDDYIEEFNTYKRLHDTLAETQSAWVVDFAKTLRLMEVGEEFDDLRAKMTDEETHSVAGIAENVEKFTLEISGSFNIAEKVDKQTDELFLATQSFLTALENAVKDKEITYLKQQTALDEVFALKKDAIDTALLQQDDNRTAFNYIIAELIKIFEINNPPPTGGEPLQSITINEEGDESEEGGGAPGSGGMDWPSKETIYDPSEEKNRHYGEVYDSYDASAEEIAEELGISEELKEILDAYFDKIGPSGK